MQLDRAQSKTPSLIYRRPYDHHRDEGNVNRKSVIVRARHQLAIKVKTVARLGEFAALPYSTFSKKAAFSRAALFGPDKHADPIIRLGQGTQNTQLATESDGRVRLGIGRVDRRDILKLLENEGHP